MKFSHGSVPFGHVLDLGYELLSIDELEEIRAHYRGQDGGHRSFRIPASIWDGTDATMVPSTGRWKYGAEPAETQSRGTVHSCSVKIIYVGQDETS